MSQRFARQDYNKLRKIAGQDPEKLERVDRVVEGEIVVTRKTGSGEVYRGIFPPGYLGELKIDKEYGDKGLVSVEKIKLVETKRGKSIRLEEVDLGKITQEEILQEHKKYLQKV